MYYQTLSLLAGGDRALHFLHLRATGKSKLAFGRAREEAAFKAIFCVWINMERGSSTDHWFLFRPICFRIP